MGLGRFEAFQVSVGQSDLWIGVRQKHSGAHVEAMAEAVRSELTECTASLNAYEKRHPGFFSALSPVPEDPQATGMISKMIRAGRCAGTGPMAAVAGAIAEKVGSMLAKRFPLRELIVENGGDVYLDIEEPVRMAVFAGSSVLSGRLGVIIPASVSPAGVCTSAGTVGPSYSEGSADAVMICCADAAEADAYATGFGNQVRSKDDVDRVIGQIREVDRIITAVVIKDDKAGICGECEVYAHS
jgi:hypothetical protein